MSKVNLAYGRCFQFTKEFVGALQEEKILGEVVVVQPRTDLFLVNSAGLRVGEQGASHVGVDVGGVIFDNFHPTGMPRAEWLKDLGVGDSPNVRSFARTFVQFLEEAP